MMRILAIVALVLPISCGRDCPPQTANGNVVAVESVALDKTAAPDETEESGLELVESVLVTDGSYKRVIGTVKNRSQNDYQFVTIKFATFDKSGAQRETVMAIMQSFGPDGVWKFESTSAPGDVVEHRFRELNGQL